MRWGAPRLLAGVGVLLAGGGGVLFARADAGAGWGPGPVLLEPTTAYRSTLQLSFDPGDRWSVLWTAGHVVGAALMAAALLLFAGLAGWLLGRRAPARDVGSAHRRLLLMGAVGLALVVAGVVVTVRTAPQAVVSFSAGYQPLCPGPTGCASPSWRVVLVAAQLGGLGAALAGASLLAGVSGRWLGAGRRADQR